MELKKKNKKPRKLIKVAKASDLKIGDSFLFDDGKEKINGIVTGFTTRGSKDKGTVDCICGDVETFLMASDFTNGSVFK